MFCSQVFASCSVDRSIRVWDNRLSPLKANVITIDQAHDGDVNVISWNKNEQRFIASGGDDGVIKIWDLSQYKVCWVDDVGNFSVANLRMVLHLMQNKVHLFQRSTYNKSLDSYLLYESSELFYVLRCIYLVYVIHECFLISIKLSFLDTSCPTNCAYAMVFNGRCIKWSLRVLR